MNFFRRFFTNDEIEAVFAAPLSTSIDERVSTLTRICERINKLNKDEKWSEA